MLDLFMGLKRVIKRRIVHIDNSVFRLHWLFTSIILISCSLIVTSRQYVGDPTDCLQTDDIPASVLNTYCWIHSTYTVPAAFEKIVGVEVAHPGIEKSKGRIYEDALDNELNQQTITLSANTSANTKSAKETTKSMRNRYLFRSTKHRKYYTYYQWVCFALFVQAILFYLPYYIWKIWEGGLLQAITLGMQLAMLSDEERGRKRKILNDYLYSHLRHHKLYAYKYFFCEFLCFVNVTFQFFCNDWFFDGEFFQYGIKVLRYAKHDQSLNYDPMIIIFPRMTKCTFHSYGFSGDVQRHDALCMLTLNVINEKIYIFIWFWLALLWFLLICVLTYRMIILVARNWRAYFLTKRCTLSHFKDLEYICSKGNIGDWFLLYMLGGNLDPLIMRDVTEEIANRMKKDDQENYKKNLINFELLKESNYEIKKNQINSTMENYKFPQCMCLPDEYSHYIKSSAPPAHLQYTNNQYCFDSPNQNLEKEHICSKNNCLSNNRIDLEENSNFIKKEHNKFLHSACINCPIQQQGLVNQRNYLSNNQKEFKQTGQIVEVQEDDDELASFLNDNQATLAANHCLKNLEDNCETKFKAANAFTEIRVDNFDRQSIKSNKSIISNKSIKKIKKPLSITVSNQQNGKRKSNCSKLSNTSNLSKISHYSITSRKLSNCTNDCCSTNKSQANTETTNSLASSGVGMDFEVKINNEGSNTELTDGNESCRNLKTKNHFSKISSNFSHDCSQNQTSGYQSKIFSNKSHRSSNISNNSDTLDQVSSLEKTSSFENTSERPIYLKQKQKASSSKQANSFEVLKKCASGLMKIKNKTRKTSDPTKRCKFKNSLILNENRFLAKEMIDSQSMFNLNGNLKNNSNSYFSSNLNSSRNLNNQFQSACRSSSLENQDPFVNNSTEDNTNNFDLFSTNLIKSRKKSNSFLNQHTIELANKFNDSFLNNIICKTHLNSNFTDKNNQIINQLSVPGFSSKQNKKQTKKQAKKEQKI